MLLFGVMFLFRIIQPLEPELQKLSIPDNCGERSAEFMAGECQEFVLEAILLLVFSGSLLGLVRSINNHARYFATRIMRRYQRVHEIAICVLSLYILPTGEYPGSFTNTILLVNLAGQAHNGCAIFPEEFKDNFKWPTVYFPPFH